MLRSSKPYEALIKRLQQAKTGRKQLSKVSIESQSSSTSTSQTSLKDNWFDELLSTHMKICRGSGVMVKIGKQWKIKHYVLSMTIPNENTNEIVKIKAPIEDAFMVQLKDKD